MDQLQHARVMNVLADALELDPADRIQFLDSACAGDPELRTRVERLLAADPDARDAFRDAAIQIRAHPADIGPYRILEMIGEGGMGVVYRAEQLSPVRRIVALKLIKLGMDSAQIVARFESERQALAILEHPGIARVYDAGTTRDGRPYFVMEYIAGEPIVQFCDRRRLDVQRRLELFIAVCDAVHHAHTKGLIHRDLKPTNILVSDQSGSPVPKIIDFGIAKAVESPLTERTVHTAHGQMVGTPGYMSPEQAGIGAADIDTRSDVYSLGVVLYELLTGALPFDATELQAMGLERILREVDPPRPSARFEKLGPAAQAAAEARGADPVSLVRKLRRELEWIPLKAMRKDRAERYRGAAELADDLRSYLAWRPLVAAPESTWYRARKLVRRHRVPFVSAVAVAGALVIGSTIAIAQAVRATRAEHAALLQKREADAANRNTKAVNEFLTKYVIGAADPAVTRGRELTVREALDRASENLAEPFRQHPLTEAEVRTSMVLAYESLGLPVQALPHAQRTMELRREHLGPAHRDTLEAINNYAHVLSSLDRASEALPYYEQLMDGYTRSLGSNHRDTLFATNNVATMLVHLGRYSDAEVLLRRAYEGYQRTLGDGHPETLAVLSNFALTLRMLDRFNDAEPLLEKSLQLRRKLDGEDHPSTLLATSAYADILQMQRKFAEALPLAKSALETRRRVLGEAHPQTLMSWNQYAYLLVESKRLQEADAAYRQLVSSAVAALGADNQSVLAYKSNWAQVLQDLGRAAEAEALSTEVIAEYRRQLGPTHPDTLQAISRYARLLEQQSRFADAEPFLAVMADGARAAQIPPAQAGAYIARHGACLVELGRYDQARTTLEEAYRRLRESSKSSGMKIALAALVQLSERTNRADDAARWRAELASLDASTPPAR